MRIAFLGDSLTEGRPGASFFVVLRETLPGYALLNYGRAGDTVADLELRLHWGGMEDVDLAFIWVGVNDAFAPGAADPSRLARLRETYGRVLGFARGHAPVCVCVTPLLPDEAGPGAGDDPWSRAVVAIAAAMADLAGGAGVDVLDLRPAFAAARAALPAAVFTIDGVHLSERGAAVVAAAFATAITERAAGGGPQPGGRPPA